MKRTNKSLVACKQNSTEFRVEELRETEESVRKKRSRGRRRVRALFRMENRETKTGNPRRREKFRILVSTNLIFSLPKCRKSVENKSSVVPVLPRYVLSLMTLTFALQVGEIERLTPSSLPASSTSLHYLLSLPSSRLCGLISRVTTFKIPRRKRTFYLTKL